MGRFLSWVKRQKDKLSHSKSDQGNLVRYSDSETGFPTSDKSSSSPSPIQSAIEPKLVQDDKNERSFWREAFQMLQEDENDRKLLSAYKDLLQQEASIVDLRGDDAPDYLSKIITDNLKLIDENHWKVQMGNTSLEVRTVLNKVGKAAQYAESFVGSMLSGEPHAAMAWAGVSLFLPLLINASEQPKALVDGIDYISDILCRFSVVERLYQEQIISVPLAASTIDIAKLRSKFEKDLAKLYAEVLRYQFRALHQLNSSKGKRVVKDMVKFDSWENLMTELKRYEVECIASSKVLDSEKLARGLKELDSTMNGLQDKISTSISLQLETQEAVYKVKQGQDVQAEQNQILRQNDCIQNFYISPPERQMNRNPNAVKGTCRWLFENPNFQNWENCESSSLLWVSAGPGCGKSVASKTLIKNLSEKRLPPQKPRTVCYFFFKEDDELQRTAENALCALLHQVLVAPGNSKLAKYAMPFYEKHGGKIRKSFTKLWGILMEIVHDDAAGEIIFILDALDECEDKGEGAGRSMLIDTLRQFHNNCIETTNSRKLDFKILITSRPYYDIERNFKDLTERFPTIHLSGDEESKKISEEIDLVIKEMVASLQKELDLDDETTISLEESLLSTTHRTYLWLRLMFDVLRQQLKTTKKFLLQVIKRLPKTVDQAYEAILNRIPKDEIGRAKKLLAIVVAAGRPLHVQEMNVALAIDEEEENQYWLSSLDIEPEAKFRKAVGNICRLFVMVIDSRIFLIHQTARSFLLSNSATRLVKAQEPDFRWKESVNLPEAHLMLGKMCINYLYVHDFQGRKVANLYFIPSQIREDLMEHIQRYIPQATPSYSLVFYAAGYWYGHLQKTTVVEDLSLYEMTCKVYEPDGLYFNLLDKQRHYHKWLRPFSPLWMGVHLKLDFMIPSALKSPDLSDHQCKGALSEAVDKGNVMVTQLILEGRKAKALNNHLRVAISGRHFDMVKLLIQHGAGKEDVYHNAFVLARQIGSSEAVKYLINCGADPNMPFKSGSKLAEWIEWPWEGLVSYTLESGVSPDGASDETTKPLWWAVVGRNMIIVKTLLEYGADVNLSNLVASKKVSNLSYALKVLSDEDEEKGWRDDNLSLEFLQSSWPHDCIIKMLIEAGAEIDGLTELESTALSHYHNRQKEREASGMNTKTGLNLGKLVPKSNP